MAKLYISEYPQAGVMGVGGVTEVASLPSSVEQTPVVIGAGSLQSAVFNPGTTFLRLHTDAICSVAVGVNPTATANSFRMAANTTEYFGLQAQGLRLAVITNT